jgi:hypothetical protein
LHAAGPTHSRVACAWQSAPFGSESDPQAGATPAAIAMKIDPNRHTRPLIIVSTVDKISPQTTRRPDRARTACFFIYRKRVNNVDRQKIDIEES